MFFLLVSIINDVIKIKPLAHNSLFLIVHSITHCPLCLCLIAR